MPPLRSVGLLVLLASAHASAGLVRTAPARSPVLVPSTLAPSVLRSPLSSLNLGQAPTLSWDGAPALPNIGLPAAVAAGLETGPGAPGEARSSAQALEPAMPASVMPSSDKGLESLHQDAAEVFDGLALHQGAVEAQAEDSDFPAGWKPGRLASAADGAVLRYRMREGRDADQEAPTVFVGGLALAESYDSYFKTQAPASDEYFLWLRGHLPSPWTATRQVYDSDARDMAAMIVAAAKDSGAKGVRLVAHSYGALVFQRMLQLTRHEEVRQALDLLKGGKVTLLNVTTHYGDSETVAGEEYAQMAKIIRAFVAWLDMMDSQAALMRQSMELNPALAPMLLPSLMAWDLQRRQALLLASQGAVKQLKDHLAQPWEPSIDGVRRRILRVIDRNAADAGWQEAFLKRANDTSRLDFTQADVERLRKNGIKLDLIHSKDDQLIPWPSAKLLFDLLGVRTPEAAPAAGSTFESPDGLFRVSVADGDHYFPLRRPAELSAILERP